MALPAGWKIAEPSGNSGGLPAGWSLDELAPEPPEISPLRTVALNATNVFGAAPAISGAISAIGGGDYASARDAYQQQIDQANEQNPISSWVGKGISLVPETVLGGAVGKVASVGAKAFGVGARLAEAAPLTQSIVKGAIGGAGYGAASAGGEALSHGQDVLPAAGEGALGGAAAGGALGAIFHGAGELFKRAPASDERNLLRGVAEGEGTSGSATPKVKKLLANQQKNVIDTLRADPELLRASRKPAIEAAPVFRGKLEAVGEQLDPAYKIIDEKTGGVSVRGLVEHLDGEIADLAKDPLNEVYSNGLAKIRDSLLDAWAPKIKEGQAVIQSLKAQGITKIPPSVIPSDVYVPTQKLRQVVTKLQTRAVDVINGLNPGESSKAKAEFAAILKDYLDSHLDAAAVDKAGEAAVAHIKQLNKTYSALATMTKAIDQRAWKEQTGSVSGRGLVKNLLGHGTVTGAVVGAVSGHPVTALGALAAHQAVEHLPGAAAYANSKLAAVARAAQAGNPNALRLLKVAQFAKQVGTAGAGAVGSSVATTAAGQGQP